MRQSAWEGSEVSSTRAAIRCPGCGHVLLSVDVPKFVTLMGAPNDRLTELDDQPARLLVPVSEAAQLLGISRGTAFELIGTGQLRSIKVGRRRLVPRQALEELVTSLLDQRRGATSS